MKFLRRMPMVEKGESELRSIDSRAVSPNVSRSSAFTLIEIMVVVAIIGIIMAMGIPSIARSMRKEGLRKAVSDMVEACSGARSAAILTGQPADLIIHPRDKTISGGTFSATIPENVGIEILGVNFMELQEADEARVHFYGNGTSDEFTIVLTSDEHKATKISLEVVTGLADVEVVR
ncbi:MAG: prepilin-type N-terminal cleavage/methylation domain-containing protein [Verrucomicrobiota bacterium]